MITWVFIILVMGILLLFGQDFVVRNNLLGYIGMVITLICIGIGIRMLSLKRRGAKERLTRKVKELEEQIKTLKGDTRQ